MPAIDMGIGINTGPLILGIVGNKEQLQMSVLGDSVNTAARLKSLTKERNMSIILGKGTFDKIEHCPAYETESLGKTRVKGKEKEIEIYHLIESDEQKWTPKLDVQS